MNKMHHAVAEEFVIVVQYKDGQGDFGSINQYDTSKIELDAVTRCEDARNAEHALMVECGGLIELK